MPLFARLLALAGLIVATAAPAETVGGFGVTATLPGGYRLAPPPGYDDGRTFLYPDGAEIRLWGSWPMAGLAEERALSRAHYHESGGRITYDTGGPGWFVLSGTLGASIFYLRVEQGWTCEGRAALAHVELLYPAALRRAYDARVTRVARSLGFGPC